MEFVEQSVKMPKELSEIKKALVELVADIAAKKNTAELISENLPLLVQAIEGFDRMAEEMKAPEAINVMALLGSEIYQALQKKPEAQ